MDFSEAAQSHGHAFRLGGECDREADSGRALPAIDFTLANA